MYRVCRRCKKRCPISEFRGYRKSCHQCENLRKLEWMHANPDVGLGRKCRAVGLDSVAEYMRKLADAGGKCAVCGGESDRLIMDHDHYTGRFRGFLCHKCNLALGHVKDRIRTLWRAMVYILMNRIRHGYIIRRGTV
jgi:hypothetical protein